MKSPRRRSHACPPIAAFALPSHWSSKQALAVFQCLELLREQLWLVYGPEIQRAWRNQLVPDRVPPNFDPDAPF